MYSASVPYRFVRSVSRNLIFFVGPTDFSAGGKGWGVTVGTVGPGGAVEAVGTDGDADGEVDGEADGEVADIVS